MKPFPGRGSKEAFHLKRHEILFKFVLLRCGNAATGKFEKASEAVDLGTSGFFTVLKLSRLNSIKVVVILLSEFPYYYFFSCKIILLSSPMNLS